MATGIAEKTCTVLFALWSLRKNDISKNEHYTQRGNIESIERNFQYLNIEKNKAKSTLILIQNSKDFSLSVTIDRYPLQFHSIS